MNITQEKTNNLNAVIKVELKPEDYSANVDKQIKDIQKKANIPGFRQGKVPKGLIIQKYGEQVKAEEINKVLGESVDNYLKDNNIKILGNPLLIQDETLDIDWANQNDFVFSFEIGLYPEVNIELNAKKSFTKYAIKYTKEDTEKGIEDLKKKFSKSQEVEVSELGDIIRGKFVEVDDKEVEVEGGISNETSVLTSVIDGKKNQSKFIGCKVGDVISKIEVTKAFKNETDLAAMLNISKDKVKDLENKFNFTVEKITRKQDAEVNQELFDMAFGPGLVTSEEEFNKQIEQERKSLYEYQTQYKFIDEVKTKLIETSKIELPEDYLRKFILSRDSKITEQYLDYFMPNYIIDMKWTIIRNKLAEENNIVVDEAAVMEYAKDNIRKYFSRSAKADEVIDENLIEQIAKNMFSQNPQEADKLYNQLFDEKIAEIVKEKAKIVEKEIKWDDFLNENKK